MYKVLIVDDEYGIRDLLSEILEDEGYQVYTAEDAQTARRTVQEQELDLILLDIWMPDMDGVSLLKEWYSFKAVRCPVIMMSGHGTIETAMEATRFGAVDFLEKPISMQRLLETCKNVLQQWEREKTARARENARAIADGTTQAGWLGASCKPITVSLANISDRSKYCDHFILTDLPSRSNPDSRLPIIEVPDLNFTLNYNIPLRDLRDNLERAYFTRVAKYYGGSMTPLAKHSGLERTHLYRKLHMLGLDFTKKGAPKKDDSSKS